MENWKKVRGFDGYEVSDLGRVKSHRSQRILKPSRGEYSRVQLASDDGTKCKQVAHLVAEAFLGPRPEGMWVCHKDNDSANNRADNLYYATPKERARKIPRSNRSRKFTKEEVIEIRERARGERRTDTANAMGVCCSTISNICLGRTYGDIKEGIQGERQCIPQEIYDEVMERVSEERARDLAGEFDISESTISRWVNGSRRA